MQFINRKMRTILIFFAFILITHTCCNCSPLKTKTANTTGNGNARCLLYNKWSSYKGGAHASTQYIKLYFGLTNNFDIELGKSYRSLTINSANFSGIRNTVLSFKYNFVKETPTRPTMAFKGYVNFNDGSKYFRPQSPQFRLIYIVQKKFKSLVLISNIGYYWVKPNKGFNKADEFRYSIGFIKPISGKLSLAGEVVGDSALKSARSFQTQYGLYYKFNPDIYFGAAYSFPLNKHAPLKEVKVGTFIRF